MIKRFLMLAAAGMLFAGTQGLYAQCDGHAHKSADGGHECASGKSCCASKKAKTTGDSPSMSEVKEINLDQLRTMVAGNGTTILDARDEQSFNAGHIEGAVLYASNTLPADKNAPLVFYCGGVKCPASSKAARKAIEQGYTNVMVFRGGWAEWSKTQS